MRDSKQNLSFFYLRIFADAKDVVNRNSVKSRKLYQNVCGDISLPKLIIAVYLP